MMMSVVIIFLAPVMFSPKTEKEKLICFLRVEFHKDIIFSLYVPFIFSILSISSSIPLSNNAFR